MKVIDSKTLEQLSLEAKESLRLRKNLNLHDDYTDSCQRLFNAMEPGTYIRPHRHLDPPKPECFMAIRGTMALIVFNDEGLIELVVTFGDGCDVIAIDLPAGCWHSLVSLKPGSIFFETKPGPYVPLSDKDFAQWAPEEGTPEARTYLDGLVMKVGHYA
jgi:cupin fold WbuC family metalloprotein